ncbi:hypothetical protein [Pelagerythrobacter aerophilus]|uniref:hypothetical protein n=1 Tax=Pelagerythrobacter aerophilus TaxID=2306995 RepID=UPI0011C43E01|nr:hypothetical protein [Pelagerythrobacter aerophilus]
MSYIFATLTAVMAGWLAISWWQDSPKREARGIIPYRKLMMYLDERGKFYPLGEHWEAYKAAWKLTVSLIFLLITLIIIVLG